MYSCWSACRGELGVKVGESQHSLYFTKVVLARIRF